MRVLLWPASYPPVLGGLQTVSHTLAQHLAAHDHEVLVVTNRHPRSLPHRELVDDVAVWRELFLTPDIGHLRRRRVDLLLGALVSYPTVLYRLECLMRSFRPQVVNVHFPDGQLPFVRWLRRRYRFRLIVSLHGHEVLRWFRNDVCIVTKSDRRHEAAELMAVLRDADVVTACSRYLLDRAADLDPSVISKGHIAYNGVELARFADQQAYRHPRPYILAFGRLTHRKGFDLLLDAFAQARNQFPHVDLVLAGEGEQREALAEQTRRLGIDQQVSFWGHASQQELVRLLNGSEFLVVPSREETFGIVALEGLAAGKPVLATRVGGLPEVVPEPPNLLVGPTQDELYRGISWFLERIDQLATFALTNRTAAGAYTWHNALATYTSLFEQCRC
jgi:glycogen(starch) synthase